MNYLIYLYVILFNIILYYILFSKKEYEPFIIQGDYIYQTDIHNKGEYSRFNHKTKECVNWVSKTICNDILFTCNKISPKILVLGVALGDMIIHMSNKRKDFIITGVDISDINYNIVKLYSTKNTVLIKEDANIYIKESNDIYDYIICDIFDSTENPEFIFTYEFLNKINSMLLPGGKFFLNSTNNKKLDIFKQSFNNKIINMKTNYVNTLYIVEYKN